MTVSSQSKKLKKKSNRTLIVAEVSANHCGSKKNFLDHILQANNWSNLVKIQTYEPQDMLVNEILKLKVGFGGKKLVETL